MKAYRAYIKSRIIMFIEAIIVFGLVFMLTKESNQVYVLTVALNNNLEKNMDREIIQKTQNELYIEKDYNPVDTFIGELTGYAGDCPLCSGYLACPPRTNVLEKGIYYDDATYGHIRIAASSKNYPCGTILRFNVNKLSEEPIIAIVLDRGVSGNNIDLLTESEEYAAQYVGRVRNLEFEILRKGWTK